MDNEHQTNSSTDANHKDSAANLHTVSSEEETSRFSRRRFLRTSAAVSPVLLSLKSPTAWANGMGGQNCSIMMSGNASNPQNCITEPLAPREWADILKSRRDSPQYPLRQSLKNGGINGNSPFNGKFLRPLNQWRYSPTKDWMFKISFRKCSNPKFKQTLRNAPNSKYKIALSFKPTSREQGTQKDDFTIILEPPRFHNTVVTAYLNSYFSPSLISYSYYPEQIETSVIQTIMTSANLIMDELNKGNRPKKDLASIYRPFTQLVRDLKRWS